MHEYQLNQKLNDNEKKKETENFFFAGKMTEPVRAKKKKTQIQDRPNMKIL